MLAESKPSQQLHHEGIGSKSGRLAKNAAKLVEVIGKQRNPFEEKDMYKLITFAIIPSEGSKNIEIQDDLGRETLEKFVSNRSTEKTQEDSWKRTHTRAQKRHKEIPGSERTREHRKDTRRFLEVKAQENTEKTQGDSWKRTHKRAQKRHKEIPGSERTREHSKDTRRFLEVKAQESTEKTQGDSWKRTHKRAQKKTQGDPGSEKHNRDRKDTREIPGEANGQESTEKEHKEIPGSEAQESQQKDKKIPGSESTREHRKDTKKKFLKPNAHGEHRKRQKGDSWK
ncbi:pre-mRNA-splicing factor 38B-like [Macrobrachium nipponense]|uniref:pre-mRNA-splicing factor 38B-like n=1 Tax=Macrobrachium nipponense TaxID=159736 RepID=UPI0030C88CA6